MFCGLGEGGIKFRKKKKEKKMTKKKKKKQTSSRPKLGRLK